MLVILIHEYQSYVQNNDTNITTLNNLATTSDSRLDIAENTIFNIGTTLSTHDNEIYNLENQVYINNESRLDNLEAFSYGVTWIGVSGGSPSVMDTLQEFSDSIQLGMQIIQGITILQSSIPGDCKWIHFSNFIANK